MRLFSAGGGHSRGAGRHVMSRDCGVRSMRVNHGVVPFEDEDKALKVFEGDTSSLSQPTIR